MREICVCSYVVHSRNIGVVLYLYAINSELTWQDAGKLRVYISRNFGLRLNCSTRIERNS